MKPVNNKSLIHFLFDAMEKLDRNIIDVETAKAQANLAKQVNNSLRYEIDRAKTEMKIKEFNSLHNEDLGLRNVEGKPID